MWSVLVSIASAEPGDPSVQVEVGPESFACLLVVDQKSWGPLPARARNLAVGRHAFLVDCPDGWIATGAFDVTDGRPVVLRDLAFRPPQTVATTVTLSSVCMERVSIDGGPPVPLPAQVELTVGYHRFVVIQASGARGNVIEAVVAVRDGQAVVNLD
jgi:hypothetical protein